MKDYPIIFSAPMVRALLDGRKTMTRRLAWRKDPDPEAADRPTPWQRVNAGDRLWVRENFAPRYFDDGRPAYMADWTSGASEVAKPPKWTPCIHMPRWASRLTLAVTAFKIEPLQNISEADAEAEGVTKVRDGCYVIKGFDYDTAGLCHSRPSIPFCKLWMHLHGEDSWLENPEVVALTFTVHKQNIDALPVAA